MVKIKTYLFFILLALMQFIAVAQMQMKNNALMYYQKQSLDSAKYCIDMAIAHPETSGDYEAWIFRGFIYKDIYKANEKSNRKSISRIVALESMKKAVELDTEKKMPADYLQGMKFLLSTLFNDAASSIDSVNYEIAIINFEKYKYYYPVVDPSKENLNQREIEFEMVMANLYSEMYRSKKVRDVKFFNLAKSSLNRVLTINPNHLSANYNMALLYYNQAVDIINDSPYDIDFVTLDKIQDNSILLLKQSLPFMEKAYELNPTKKETLIGLSGIYFGLNEKEKSELFKTKIAELEK